MQSWSEREIEADPLAMGLLSSDDPGSYEADYRAIKLERIRESMTELGRLMVEHLLQDYLKPTEYSSYEKVEKLLAEYVSNGYTPDTSELKLYLQAVSADERFELLKKQYVLGTTALHKAAESGHIEDMRCLLQLVEPENQIQLLDIPNEYNQTALDVAEGEETVQLIRQYRKSAVREIAEGKSPRDLLSYVLNDLSLVGRQSLMSDERLRSITFLVNWPHDGNLSGIKMAQAGFYCVDHYDTVQCTFCHESVHNWEVEDNPMTKHIKLFPSCPFVKGFELGIKEYKNENNTDKRDVTTETSGELLEDSGDLKDAEEQIAMQSNEKESSLPATSVDELVGGERWDVLLEPADEINGITEDMDISFQDTVVESKHSAVVNNVQPDSVLVQELELAKLKIAELEAELAGYQSDAGRGSNELRDTVEGQIVSLTGVEVSSSTSDRTHNEDIAGTQRSLVNEDEDEPEPESTVDKESLKLTNITKNIDMTVEETRQNIDMGYDTKDVLHGVQPAKIEVKVKERPEEKEIRDQNSVLRQKLGLAKLRIAELEEQLAAVFDKLDKVEELICGCRASRVSTRDHPPNVPADLMSDGPQQEPAAPGTPAPLPVHIIEEPPSVHDIEDEQPGPSNAAAAASATDRPINVVRPTFVQPPNHPDTVVAIQEVGPEMDIRVRRGSDSSLEEED